MNFRLAAESSGRIAAIAPVAGACWMESVSLECPVPMCYISGTADPLNLISGGVPRLANGDSDEVRAKPKPPCEFRFKGGPAHSAVRTPPRRPPRTTAFVPKPMVPAAPRSFTPRWRDSAIPGREADACYRKAWWANALNVSTPPISSGIFFLATGPKCGLLRNFDSLVNRVVDRPGGAAQVAHLSLGLQTKNDPIGMRSGDVEGHDIGGDHIRAAGGVDLL